MQERVTDSATPVDAHSHRGIALVVAVSLAHFGAALALGERGLSSYFTARWAIELAAFVTIPFGLWLLYQLAVAYRARAASPLRHIAAALSAERYRFGYTFALLASYALVNRAYRAIKVAIPRLNDFWADPLFIDWDRATFGTDPWHLTHAVLKGPATQFVDAVYSTWFAVILMTYCLCAFARDRAFQLRSCFTYLLIWILLGNGLALALSSAGPVYFAHFFGNDLFVPLLERLEEQQLVATRLQQFLLTTQGDEAIGTGISAMPSVHCAMTMLIVLIAWDRYRIGLPLFAALAYHVLILVGSVHLGWHYAWDGLLSTALVPLIWWGAKALIGDAKVTRS